MAVFSTALNYGSIVRRLPGGSSTLMDSEWNLLPRAVAVPPRYRSLHARLPPERRGVRRRPAPATRPLRVWHWSRPCRPHWVPRLGHLDAVRLVPTADQARSPVSAVRVG